jgi:arginyl-tRNA synthetase
METQLREAILRALKTLGLTADVDFVVEHPNDLAHGDYATNVAMVIAKGLQKNPRDLAEEIVAALKGQELRDVAEYEVAGPGFINIRLHRDFFKKSVATILETPSVWGTNKERMGEVVLIEYTSPNLFKPLHVGNLVGNIIGESITRLYEASGADVRRINFPSDIGLTVAKGVWGLQKTGGDASDIHALGEAYRVGNEAYEKGAEEKEAIDALNKTLYEGTDEELNTLCARGIETSLARIRELCAKLGTKFDTEIFESEAGPLGMELVRAHMGSVFHESEGAVVYRGEEEGLHTRVFLTSKGIPTYEAKDLGNFALKQKAHPDWTSSLVVTGGEQREYFKVIIAAIKKVFEAAGKKEMLHVPTGFLTLTTGKMSSRKGNVLTGESILAETEALARERASADTDVSADVAVAALKYEILRHGIGADIVFDKEKALSFEGDSGPYLQYTHARIGSALVKASEAGVVPSLADAPPEPYEVEKILYRFPEVVLGAARSREPHQLVSYLIKVASSFNTLYAHERIADSTDPHAPYKAALASAVRQTLRNGLHLLGIKAPERM